MKLLELLLKPSKLFNFYKLSAIQGTGGLPGPTNPKIGLYEKIHFIEEFKKKSIPNRIFESALQLFDQALSHHKNGIMYANNNDHKNAKNELLKARDFYSQLGNLTIDFISNSYTISYNVYMLFCAFGEQEAGLKYLKFHNDLHQNG